MEKKAEECISLKVLCLEDSSQDAEVIRELLIDAEIDLCMDCAATEKEFVTFLNSRKYDIILADFKLPGFDAFGALRYCVDICPDVPFICVSGTIGEETAVELIRHGAVDYVLKDRLKRLPSAIKRALDEAKDKEALRQAEEVLRESEEIFRNFMEHSPIYVFFKDENIRALRLSRNYETLLGKPMTELLGKNMDDLFPSEIAKSMVADDMRILKEGKEINVEEELNDRYYSTIKFPIFIEGKPRYLAGFTIDITERKQAEQTLRESEGRFRLLYEKAPLGYQSLDVAGCFIDVNQAWLDTLGYSREEVIGRWFGDFLAPIEVEAFKQRFPKFKATGEIQVEVEMVRKDGAHAIIAVVGRIAYDEQGGFKQTHCILTDITERKRTEEALEKSEQLLQKAQKTAHIGHWELVPKIGTPTWSDEIFRIFGIDPQKDTPSFVDHENHVHPDDWTILNKAVTKASADGTPFDLQFRIVRPSGEIKWMHALCTTTMDSNGVVSKLFGTAQDITERKRAETELHIALEKYRVLFESFPLGISVTDAVGNIVETNRESERLLGVPRDEQNRRKYNGSEWRIVRPDRTPMPSDEYAGVRALKEKKLMQNIEMGIVKPDNTTTWISVTAVPLPLEGYGVVITYNDITERKRAEEQIRKDLIEKEVMLKEIHHRVKNNLNVITSLLNLQVDRITNKSQALAAFEESKNRIYAMALIHENLYREQDFSQVDLKSFIGDMTQNLLLVYQRDVKIDVRIKDLSLDLNNAVPCGLILNELVTNALKHAFKDKSKGLITIDFRILKDDIYELTVQDNGVGLPKEIDAARSKSLGFLIVNQLINQIEGVLKITRGKGTQFQITFPVSAT